MRTHRLPGLLILIAVASSGVAGSVSRVESTSLGPVVTVTGALPLIGSITPVRSTSLNPEVTVTGASADEARKVTEALERFRRESLGLPDMSISFDDSREACAGYPGLFQPGSSPAKVTVCDGLEFIVTHELAHAWVDHYVDAQRREAYLRFRCLNTWNDADASWRERGTEDAAFVIQQVLWQTQPVPDNELWLDLAAAYEFLTGLRSSLRSTPEA